MGETVQSTPELSKEYILNIRFPYKLWILVNTENQAAVWGPDGTTILVNYAALDLYLSTSSSIFKLKTGYKFLRQLTIHDFEKVTSVENDKDCSRGVFLEYSHVSFIRNRHDLLGKIIVNKELTKQNPKSPIERNLSQQPNHRAADPCFSKIRPLSAIEKARLHLRIHLRMRNENYTLNRKLSDCERKSPSSAVSVIELPADSFENPFDSISQFEENPEYAGYYGHASTEQIKQFFDEYLPIYAQANDEVSERQGTQNSQKEAPQPKQSPPTSSYSYVVPNEQNEKNSSDTRANPSNFQIKYSVNLDASHDSKEYTLNILEETCSRVASSNVDPDVPMNAYAVYEDVNDPNGRDEDISMDEYLKFKNNEEKPALEKDEKFNETSCDIKPELIEPKGENITSADDEMKESNEAGDVEDDSSENNFKHFFNQYRESINLLYD